jgi:hypothetical protein
MGGRYVWYTRRETRVEAQWVEEEEAEEEEEEAPTYGGRC